ncbi:MAG: glycyl-radical enzyme activating protein [Candidatus Fermentibacteraceae bacterium]|nr:glycyl-radical enzyme activating protein [Candidatus Fermentibacteraceae bacterium]
MNSGVVFQYKRYSLHDGPGIRTTVFLKGCPLSCSWCHNPESISPLPQLVLLSTRCFGCGECASACPSGAVDAKRPGKTDRTICTLCGECVRACPAGARAIAGQRTDVEEVMTMVERDLPFYEESGGGVTFSGGEPLMQPDFLAELLSRCRERGIHTAVDTSCHAPAPVFMMVAGLADLMLCDLKLAGDPQMLEYTGVKAGGILDNIRALAEDGGDFVLRMPVIPGVTDAPDNLRGVADFIKSLSRRPVLELLPYHSAYREKYRRLGITVKDSFTEDTGRRLTYVRESLTGAGIVIGIEE